MDRFTKTVHTVNPDVSQTPELLYQRARKENVPPAVLLEHRLVAGMANDGVADAYRLLRTRILNMMKREGWKVLGVTSPGAQEGKSLTAANLAISMAREPNTTVLLLDADLRRPAQHRYFGLQTRWGLAEYLQMDLSWEEVIIVPGIERLMVLPCIHPAEGSSELLGSPKMGALLKDCKSRSDIQCVVVDLPPVLSGDDVLMLSPHIDALLLVIDDGRTQAAEIAKSLEVLDRVPIVGSVLNRSEESVANYRS
jgi:capsular exopolysaccharide synthesis family protein